MPQVSGYIPNLVNGVSQQAPALRLPSQAEASENFYPTLVDGLTKRPRLDWLTKLIDAYTPGATFTHFILRDEVEKYVVLITKAGVVRVFTIDGVERTVDNQAPTYLQGTSDTELELKALTIADNTFIVNTNVKVLPRASYSPTRPFEALYYVNSGNYSKTYAITINGATAASYTTPDSSDVSHEGYVDTSYIAQRLYTAISSSSGTASKARYGSTVYYADTDNDFTTSSVDGYGGRSMKAIKGKLQKFSDLPSEGPDGFVVQILGSDTTSFDNYWVELKEGQWTECLAPGSRLGFDASTMPHTLVRNSDGTFTFKEVDYADRKVGNVEKVPDPSFVGQTIQDLFFFRDRFGFLTEENVVMSNTGDFFNFYRGTLTTTLDTDPIDVAASNTKVSLLKHAVPIRDNLMAFSDRTQFRVSGNDFLTPKSVSARPLTDLTAAPLIRPVTSKTDIYFVAEQDGYAQLQEFYLERDGQTADVDTPSEHCPAYVPAGVVHMACSPDLDLVTVVSRGEPQTMFVYKYFYQGQDKLQSAWCKWTFPGADQIVNMTFDKGSMLVLLARNGQLHLERLRCEQRTVDAPLPYNVYLDHHIALFDGGTYTYDATSNKTTITLPYDLPADFLLVSTFGGDKPVGVEFYPSAVPGHSQQLTVSGDVRGQPFRAGIPYEARYTFSQFFYRAQNTQTSGKTAVNENGRLQVMNLNIVYARTAYFEVHVTCDGRRTRTYPISGRRLSAANNNLNDLILADGHTNVPIYSRNDRVKIELVSPGWQPVAFESAEWRGNFYPTTREA